jgi:hypothetical protein
VEFALGQSWNPCSVWRGIRNYHTGLGPYGYGEAQCEQVSGLAGHERAARVFGPFTKSPVVGSLASTTLHGTLDELWPATLGDRHTYVCLEFGTFADCLDEVLRNDHWVFMHRPEAAEAGLDVKFETLPKRTFTLMVRLERDGRMALSPGASAGNGRFGMTTAWSCIGRDPDACVDDRVSTSTGIVHCRPDKR